MTNAKIAKLNSGFMKIMSSTEQDEDEMEYERSKKKAAVAKEKRDKEYQEEEKKKWATISEEDKQQMHVVMEKFFIQWLIHRNFNECRDCCDEKKVYFFDKHDGNDSRGYHIIMIQMYYYYTTYEKERIKIENHFIDNNTLWYRARRRNGTYFDAFIEYTLNDKLKISRISVGALDENGNVSTIIEAGKRPKPPINKNTVDRFAGKPKKTYDYGPHIITEVSPLPMWDHEVYLESQKGTLYVLMFKLFKAWLITQDVEDLARMMDPEVRLYDKMQAKEFFSARDAANYFYTFVAHHATVGIYVRQYKIFENELVVKVHWPDATQWADILVTTRINKDTNLFTEIIFRSCYYNAFDQPGDVTIEALKKMEIVHKSRIADRDRKREDFRSAVLFKTDKNITDLEIDTFATSDTEVFLANKIINEKPYCRRNVPIESRLEIVPSPKAPVKLIYDFKSSSYDTEELFGLSSTEDKDENKNKNVVDKKKKTKKDLPNDSDSFAEPENEKDVKIVQLQLPLKSNKNTKDTKNKKVAKTEKVLKTRKIDKKTKK